jgi:hypothetical protein
MVSSILWYRSAYRHGLAALDERTFDDIASDVNDGTQSSSPLCLFNTRTPSSDNGARNRYLGIDDTIV